MNRQHAAWINHLQTVRKREAGHAQYAVGRLKETAVLVIVAAAAVLFAIAQAQTAQTAAERAARTARTARKEAGAALGAKAHADGAAVEALAGLDQIRAQTVEQLAACQTAAEQARAAARAAHIELEEVRAAAAAAITTAQEAADVAIRKVIADQERTLTERADDMRQQIEQVKADAQAQVNAIQDQVDAAKVEAEQLAACQTAAEQAQATAHTARIELEEVRAAVAKAVTAAKEVAEVAVRKAIVDQDRGLAERAPDMREQIEQAKTETQAQVKTIKGQADAAKVQAEQLVENIRANSPTRPTRRPASKPRKPPNEP
jgi:chemosensory pili system protein ChpA (sensor histidine kinase/response regulator)